MYLLLWLVYTQEEHLMRMINSDRVLCSPTRLLGVYVWSLMPTHTSALDMS